jgi:hypothetical protein
MTLGDVRALIAAFQLVDGQPYIPQTNTADTNSLINERLRAFTAETLCLDTFQNALTLTPGQSVYDYRNTISSNAAVDADASGSGAFAQPMARVSHIYVNGAALLNQFFQPGPFDRTELLGNFGGYATDSGTPARFVLLAPNSIMLHPTPDQAYPNCWAIGQILHPVLANDNAELMIPEEYHRTAAIYCWATLNMPMAAGASMDRIKEIEPYAARQMEDLLEQAQQKRTVSATRRKTTLWQRVGTRY